VTILNENPQIKKRTKYRTFSLPVKKLAKRLVLKIGSPVAKPVRSSMTV
jgi:hypothetical protein